MKYFLIIFTLLLSGCYTIPTTAKFPDAPHELLEKCPQLKTTDVNDPSIVSMSKIIVENYTTYYQCSNKIDGWIAWYNSQKSAAEKSSCTKFFSQCK